MSVILLMSTSTFVKNYPMYSSKQFSRKIYQFKKATRGAMVKWLDSHGNGPGSIPGPGIVHLWFCVLLNVVMPRRSDGTLNRGLVCVAHQTWTVKIPTALRKRICDCRLKQIRNRKKIQRYGRCTNRGD